MSRLTLPARHDYVSCRTGSESPSIPLRLLAELGAAQAPYSAVALSRARRSPVDLGRRTVRVAEQRPAPFFVVAPGFSHHQMRSACSVHAPIWSSTTPLMH